ncbi:hypothetical protein BH23BAC3_BH23BAC3_07980 [soil metagenome]
MKRSLLLNLKNLYGWRTKRKIVVISVDDYGNVRLDSKKARDNLDRAGINIKSPFSGLDLYDTLETRDDLEILFNTLSSVKDKNGRHAVFTPFAVPCNINFEKVEESGFKSFYYEILPETYKKLSACQPDSYQGTWKLWKEGIDKKLVVPQFHGREHINLGAFSQMLENKSPELLANLRNRSLARIRYTTHSTISISAAFDFWEPNENEKFNKIIEDGLKAFEKVFGYKADHFNPPGGREHPVIHQALKINGIEYIDTPLMKKEHQGKGKYKTKINYTGKRNKLNQLFMVRNVVFEPTRGSGKDGVNYAIKQIEAAFRWNRPAIISSHRVNYCGHIDEKNRRNGITALRELLNKIVQRWPEVEFMAANELGELINSNAN